MDDSRRAALTLVTPRLSLRPATEADIDALHRLWTDPEVRRFLWDGEIITRETAAEVIGDLIACFDSLGFGLWVAATFEAPRQTIGFAYLRPFGEPVELEIGYGLDPAQWHRGYATEIARALLRFGFEALGREHLYARTDLPNAASVQVMERAGMRFAGRSDEGAFGGTLTYVLRRAELPA